MNYRTLRDPHLELYEWRVMSGERYARYNTTRIALEAVCDSGGVVGGWHTEKFPNIHISRLRLFEHTPERVALWAELLLDPFE